MYRDICVSDRRLENVLHILRHNLFDAIKTLAHPTAMADPLVYSFERYKSDKNRLSFLLGILHILLFMFF